MSSKRASYGLVDGFREEKMESSTGVLRIEPREGDLSPVSVSHKTTRPIGIVGLSSTAMDYARYALMLLNGGELNGVRVLGKKTVELMKQNHLPKGLLAGRSGYGLGVSVTLNPAAEGNLNSVGSFGWSGWATTKFYIDPAEDIVAVICTQHMPYNTDILNQFQTLVYQTIVK